MPIDNIIEKGLNDIRNLASKEAAKKVDSLKKEIKKEGNFRLFERLSNSELGQFLKFFKKFQSCFNPGKKRLDFYKPYQENIIELYRMRGDLENMMETLADSGYKLDRYFNIDLRIVKSVFQGDINIFEDLLRNDLFKKYSAVFNALKKGLGYKSVSSYGKREEMRNQTGTIIKLSQSDGDIVGAIYVLASNDYKINEKRGIIKSEVEFIENITKEIEKGKSRREGGSHIYLYKKGNVEIFKKYFSDLSSNDKGRVLESIFKYEYNSDEQNMGSNKKGIQEWLEKEYPEIVREIGIKSVE